MDKEKFNEIIKAIGTCEDEAERRTMLAELSEATSKVFDENASLTETNKSVIDDNEKLRSANQKLFLMVGADKTDQQRVEDQTGLKEETKEPRKFENLFNEKGELK
ncbi:MAG: hypothetical protein IJH63_04460 [Methanobrevibacter sp.]|nr:hypothetical protein [Methanobrevibacter sp.]